MTQLTKQFAAGKVFAMILMLLIGAPSQVIANPGISNPEKEGSQHEATTGVAITDPENQQANASNGLITRLQRTMPHLDQALIIFSSVNGILIVSGLLLVFLKERLHRQSAQTLATLKSAHSGTAQPGSRDKSNRHKDVV
jgi:hypothetical protein